MNVLVWDFDTTIGYRAISRASTRIYTTGTQISVHAFSRKAISYHSIKPSSFNTNLQLLTISAGQKVSEEDELWLAE